MMSRPISSTLASGLPSLRGALEPAEACTTAFGRSTLGRLAISGRKVGVGVGVSVMAAPVGLEGGGLEGGVLAVGRTGLPTARRWLGIGGRSSAAGRGGVTRKGRGAGK